VPHRTLAEVGDGVPGVGGRGGPPLHSIMPAPGTSLEGEAPAEPRGGAAQQELRPPLPTPPRHPRPGGRGPRATRHAQHRASNTERRRKTSPPTETSSVGAEVRAVARPTIVMGVRADLPPTRGRYPPRAPRGRFRPVGADWGGTAGPGGLRHRLRSAAASRLPITRYASRVTNHASRITDFAFPAPSILTRRLAIGRLSARRSPLAVPVRRRRWRSRRWRSV